MLRFVNIVLLILTWNKHGGIAEDSDNLESTYFSQDYRLRLIKGSQIREFMNTSVNPCDDFYEYACAQWTHPKKLKTKDILNVEMLRVAQLDEDINNLLQEPTTVEEGQNDRKAKIFYKSCLEAERNGPLQQQFFNNILTNHSGFPAIPGSNWKVHHYNYDWQKEVANLRLHYGIEVLIGIEVDANYQNLEENSIYLSEPNRMLINDELCNRQGTHLVSRKAEEYQVLENYIAKRLNDWLGIKLADAEQIAADIITFEYELCSAIEPLRVKMQNFKFGERKNLGYVRKSLYEFSNDLNESIDFNRIVSCVFKQPIYKPIYLRSVPYFVQLAMSIQRHPTEVVANYIMYQVFDALDIPEGNNSDMRTAFCIQQIKQYFSLTIEELYRQKYSNSHAKAETAEIFDKIKYSFGSALEQNWVEDVTKRIGNQKLSEIQLILPNKLEKPTLVSASITPNKYWYNMQQLLGQVQLQLIEQLYENPLQNVRHKQEFSNEPLAVEGIRYQPMQNRIVVGWSALQAPQYQIDLPYAMKYATIGSGLARELVKAFDAAAWNADISGLTNWDRSTESHYLHRSECFREQLSNYLFNNPSKFHDDFVLLKLIADIGGLNVAFNAYLHWLSFMNPNNDQPILLRETLMGLNLSNTQLFFVTFAQQFCHRHLGNRSIVASAFSPRETHTLERFMVNGPLRNSREFARDFNCATGSEMNPVDKCIIY